MLLTRAPLYSGYCYPFLVRLACVRHAASVDSEPGSNSRLKPSLSSYPTEVGIVSTTPAQSLRRAYYLPCEKIKPNLIVSHDWHVQSYCQRSLRAVRLSGAPFGSRPKLLRQGVLELIAHCQNLASKRSSAFLREPSKPIEVPMPCQAKILWESSLQLFHHRQAVLPAYSIDIAARLVGRRRSHCAKYQRATGIKCLAPQRRTKGFSSRVMQWVCSLRDSLQGLG